MTPCPRSGVKARFLMPVLYALAGRNALRNRFEIEAGLVQGGYVHARYARKS